MAATDSKPVGGKPDKLIRDALKAALRQDATQLKRIAENWCKRAENDQVSANALADRLDGKAVQPISGDDENPLQIIARIERVIVDPANKDS